MDLEQFTSRTFNPVSYLNQQLPAANPDTYYASATTLLPSLELLARNTHSDLTAALNSLLRTSTRLGIDMDTLQHDTRTLAAQIPQVEVDIAGLQLESGAMSELSLLEVVQERMQQTRDIFVQAGQWNSQKDEGIRFLIESGKYDVAGQRIAELRELVGVWEGTVEYKERVERIQILEKALTNAYTVASTAPSVGLGQRGTTRPQSKLRVDNSDGILRESGGIFGRR
jgi:hypothetical protein